MNHLTRVFVAVSSGSTASATLSHLLERMEAQLLNFDFRNIGNLKLILDLDFNIKELKVSLKIQKTLLCIIIFPTRCFNTSASRVAGFVALVKENLVIEDFPSTY